jgi:hypothetical protein
MTISLRAGWAVIATLCAAMLVSPLEGQGDDQYTRPSLKGIRSVSVGVVLDDELTAYVTQQRLQTIMELAMRQYGLDINEASQADALVSLTILALPQTTGDKVTHFAVAIDFNVLQPVALARDQSILALASTWSTGAVGSWGTQRVREASEQASKEYAEQFVNTVLSVR